VKVLESEPFRGHQEPTLRWRWILGPVFASPDLVSAVVRRTPAAIRAASPHHRTVNTSREIRQNALVPIGAP
jgi:hypothetical protein